MSVTQMPVASHHAAAGTHPDAGATARNIIIALTAFLTLVDLFATQAILPSLALHYRVSPAAMGTAVNAATFGMAAASLAVALLSRRIERRRGILASLLVLAVPTALLAHAPDLTTFTALRVAQGLCMAAAFTLTLAHLGERCDASAAAGAFAAYITGNVASNLVGRLVSAALADHFGLAWNFYAFAALNLAGAALVFLTLGRAPAGEHAAMDGAQPAPMQTMASWAAHLRDPRLRAGFGIGFCILFAFIGTFTYVNFELVRPPLGVSMMGLGLVYFAFAPSVVTTPVAGRAASRWGTRPATWGGIGLALLGLPLLLAPWLPAVLAGLAMVGVGSFFAQAIATGHVGRTATGDRGTASGLYLACYFAGGLLGSIVLGRLYEAFGWSGCVAGIGAALAAAAALAVRMTERPAG